MGLKINVNFIKMNNQNIFVPKQVVKNKLIIAKNV